MAMARSVATSSDRKTADAVVYAQPCILKSLILEGDGTNAASVILYDNASAASGAVLAKLLLKASSGDLVVSFESSDGIYANNGIYADVTGTGAAYTVHYAPGG